MLNIVNKLFGSSSSRFIKSHTKTVKIINMKENRGHARCNAAGLKYTFEKEEFDYVIPMDGDGEDRPEEIKSFVDNLEYSPDIPIVGERVKRSENFIFKFCYLVHKLLTFLLISNTLSNINVLFCFLFFRSVKKSFKNGFSEIYFWFTSFIFSGKSFNLILLYSFSKILTPGIIICNNSFGYKHNI